MNILIIRHGEPDYQNDTLTDKGWIEAELLSKRLKKINISKIYCSPLGRAKDTAKATLEKKGMQPEILDWLQEFPIGVKPDYDSKNLPAFLGGYHCPWDISPQYWNSDFEKFFDGKRWMEHSVYVGSGVYEYYTNVGKEYDKLLLNHGYERKGQIYDIKNNVKDNETIALFCHMGLGLLLISHITKVPLPQMWHGFHILPSSVTTVVMQRTPQFERQAIARVTSLGDLSHLYN